MIEVLTTTLACILMGLGSIMADESHMVIIIIAIYLIGVTQGMVLHG